MTYPNNTDGRGCAKGPNPTTQLVDCSYLAYKNEADPRFPNPTNAVGGLFILSLVVLESPVYGRIS